MFQPNDLPILNDLQTVQGSSFSFPFSIGCSSSGFGFSAFMNVPASGLGIVPFVVDNNDTLNGIVSMNLSSQVSATLPPGTFPYQFSYTDLNGFITTFMQGTFLVLPTP